MVLLKEKRAQKIPESSILKSASWKRGYAAFNTLFKKPLGWLYLATESSDDLIRLDRKTRCPWDAASSAHEKSCEEYLLEFARSKKEDHTETIHSFRCHEGELCAAFPLKLLNGKQGCFMVCNLKEPISRQTHLKTAFYEFLKEELNLVRKDYELRSLYEAVQPKALALSALHSIHRVISTAFSLNELLPRIARLCMQILKVKHCSISLLDRERKHLLCKFSTGQSDGTKLIRKKLGHGIDSKVVLGGEIHFGRHVLAVPFIEKDVFGVIMLKARIDKKSFTATDLEVLQMLSEQTVVAIKNAQLYDEMHELTMGSIKSIADLLELNYSGDNVHLPLFAQLVREMGADLGLSRHDLVDLERAVHLLDTGYIGLPQKILSKKTGLTQKEYELIKKHPSRGAQVLKSISSLKPLLPIILHHHERYDGRGYPQGLAGEEIPIGARIVAVADSFTAIISKRPYRESKKVSEAIEEIQRHIGSQFDPKVVTSFLKVIQSKKITKDLL